MQVPIPVRPQAFNCPHCHAYAYMAWREMHAVATSGHNRVDGWDLAYCARCSKPSLWHDGQMMIPSRSTAPQPHRELPAELREDYEEARIIVGASPRGAAALLRLAIQKLCISLGAQGPSVDANIADLVAKGLPVGVQQALDSVRVIGNESVHPGTMDLRDTPELALSLFSLVNFIVEKMIAEPKKIEAIFAALPENKREAIARRDAKAKDPA